MTTTQPQGGLIIVLTFIVSLMLAIVNLPEWLEEIRPQFTVMVLIYWSMALPLRVSVGVGWIMGLLLDIAHAAILGQHALALALIAFLTAHFHQRLRVFPPWQQAIVVFFFCLIYNLIELWIKGITGNAPEVWSILPPSFTSALCWPIIFAGLRHLRRLYRVS